MLSEHSGRKSEEEFLVESLLESQSEQLDPLEQTSQDISDKFVEYKSTGGDPNLLETHFNISEDSIVRKGGSEIKKIFAKEDIVENEGGRSFDSGEYAYQRYEKMELSIDIYEREIRQFKTGVLVKRIEKIKKIFEINKIDDPVKKQKAIDQFEANSGDISLIENPQEAVNNWIESMKNNKEEFGTVKSFLLSREMASLFNNLKEGDTMFSSLVPSNDDFSIKNMNDKFFGQQQTDEIIAFRKHLIREKFKGSLNVLNQDFKQDVFVLKSGLDLTSGDLDKEFARNMEDLELEMNQHIKGIIEKNLKSLKEDENGLKQKENLTALYKRIEEGESSYELTYGMATVGEVKDGDQSAKMIALSESLQMAQMSRSDSESSGGTFSFEKQGEQVAKIQEIANELFEKNVFVDKEGLSYEIFNEKLFLNAKGEKDRQRGAINPDLLRAIRKNKLKVKEGEIENELILEKLKDYKEAINFFDYVKPQIAEEISEGSLAEDLNYRKNIARKLEEGDDINSEEFERIFDLISKELKDQNCTSKAVFHEKAVQIDNCSYISLDVLDVGVDILLSYEELANKMSKGNMDEEAIKKEMLAIGDGTTIKMRKFRATVLDVLKANGIDEPISLVGGDEFTIALDTTLVTENLLLDIKKATNTRVIHTAVASTERTSDLVKEKEDFTDINDEGFEERFTEHLLALKRAEMGAAKAKEIEAAFRNLKRRMKFKPKQNVVFGENGFNPVRELYDNPAGFETAVSDAKYVVVDTAEGKFQIIWEGADGENHIFSADDMVGNIGQLINQF